MNFRLSQLVASKARIPRIEHFSLNKDEKSSYATTVERPVCNIEQENSDSLCKWLELEAEIYSMFEIYSKMIELVGENKDVFTKRWKLNIESILYSLKLLGNQMSV